MEPADRLAFEELLALDPALREEVRDLQELRDALRREAPPSRHWAVWGLAAAAGLAALLFYRAVPPAGEPGPAPATLSPAAIVAIRDAGREVVLRADGTVAGLPGLSLEARAAVMAALHAGELPQPEALAPLRGAKGALMGGSAVDATFHPAGPVATFVRSQRPTFRWTRHPRARGYEVMVFSEDLVKVGAVRVSGATEATLPSSLDRGATYLWQVAALTPAGRIVAPAPPEPEARFRVLGATEAGALDRSLVAAGDSDLAAGVLLARAGVRDEAEIHFTRLAAANPGSVEAGRLLEAIRR
jgi:hypothetical protein